MSLPLITVNKFPQNWLSTPDMQQKSENLQKVKNFQVRTSSTCIACTAGIFEHSTAWVVYRMSLMITGDISLSSV